MLTVAAIAAVIAGLTGAWSPCGFSMVETLAPHGYAGRRSVALAACVTFAVGALVGGVITFGGLAVLGNALGAGGTVAAIVAGVVALVAAAGEARGTRIVPQVRRQVPEPWRRVLPVPVAAALYGVLLGLGFTTFILTFAVWALAALSVALGDPAVGLAIGLGFGVGRTLPVIVLAPLAETERGSAAHAAMAERPRILRTLRALDAAALVAVAVALLAAPASAEAAVAAREATDPSAAGGQLAFHRPGATGVLIDAAGATRPLPGRFPALGDGAVAWVEPDALVVADAATLSPTARIAAPGADAVAVSAGWVAWRAAGAIVAQARTPGATPRTIAKGSDLGRPSLEGARLVFHQATRRRSMLRDADLATGKLRTLRSARGALLLNPSTRDGVMLYVRSTADQQLLRLITADGKERTLRATTPTGRRDAGHEPGKGRHKHGAAPPKLFPRPPAGKIDTLWTTALGADAVYVTRLRATKGGGATATLLRYAR